MNENVNKLKSYGDYYDLACQITKNNVKQLNLTSPKIRQLHVIVDEVNPQGLLHCLAPKTNKTLTELVLCGARPMGPLFGDLVQCLPNLTTLDLDCDERITGEEMEYVFRYLINLRHLILDRCVGENDIKYVPSKANISNLERLQILDSCWCPIKVLQISNLNFEFRELKTLRLTSCRKADSVLNAVDFKKYFPALERLLSGDLPDDLHRYYENLFIDAWETRKSFLRLRHYKHQMLF